MKRAKHRKEAAAVPPVEGTERAGLVRQDLSPEERALLALLGNPEGTLAGFVTGEAGRVDWPKLLRLASPALHPYLNHLLEPRHAAPGVPEDVLTITGQARRANAARHLQRRAELKVVLGELEDQGIPVVVLKGMVLAHETYEAPSHRPMMDIDLLISSGKYERAKTALEGVGYRIPERYTYRSQVGHDGVPQMEKPLQRPDSKILIELHTSLEFGEAQGKVDLTAMQTRTRDVDLDGLHVRTLNQGEFLIHLCHHASSHHLFDKGLLPMVDIDLFVRRHGEQLDWPALAGTALLYGGAEWVYLTLKLARDLLRSPVPDSFFARVPPPRRIEEVTMLATRQILRSGEAAIAPGLLDLVAQPGLKKALWFGRRLSPWGGGRTADRSGGGVMKAALTAPHKLIIDLKTRARIYGGSWRRGDLTRENLEKALELQQDREAIVRIMTGRSAKAAAAAGSSSRK